jgi:hypothetical protein
MFQAKMANCKEEEISQSEFSPGIVEDYEKILYVLIDPLQYQNGEIKPTAFSKSKLQVGKLSVVRVDHSSTNEVKSKVIEPQLEKGAQKGENRQFVGCLTAIARSIREVDISIIDQALSDFPAHAHLKFSAAISDKNQQVAARQNLILVFNGIKTLEEAFLNN